MKKKYFLISLFCFLFISIIGISCNDTPVGKEKNIESIELVEKGKTEYKINESFELTGFKLKINYDDNSSEIVDLTEKMIISSIDITSVGVKTIKVTYPNTESTTEFLITVTDTEPFVVSMDLKTKGLDHYTFGIDLDMSGYIFTITYSDNTKKDITIEASDVSHEQFRELNEGEQETITCVATYTSNGKSVSCKFDIILMEAWDYEDYLLLCSELEVFKRIESRIEETKVCETTENLEFLKSEEFDYICLLYYSTSNMDVISPSGNVVRDEEDELVTITLKVKGTFEERVYSWDVLVKGLGPVVLRPIKPGQKLIFSYFYEGTSENIREEDARKIDVVHLCFGRIINGELNVSSLNLQNVGKWRREYGLRVLLSIGGGGDSASSPFSMACRTEENRTKLVNSIMEVVKKYKFDGVDIDWEYPSWNGLTSYHPSDVSNFTKLCQMLRKSFDDYKEGLILSSAVISSSTRFYEVKELDKYLDYLHVMSYDGNNSGIATHHTQPYGDPYSAEKALNLYINAGFSPSKVVIGAAFYGKISQLTTPTNKNGDVLRKAVTNTKTIQYTRIVNEYLNNPDYVERYDSATGAYYLTNGVDFITYDNPRSIYTKCDLVKKYGLGGIMFWDYGSDNTGQLLNAMKTGIDQINR